MRLGFWVDKGFAPRHLRWRASRVAGFKRLQGVGFDGLSRYNLIFDQMLGQIMDEIQIPLSSPDVTDAEIQAVVEVMRTRHLSLGPKVPEFEDSFRRYLGVDHAIAVSSGTAGLHCCLLALEIGPGDEVITTPFSFIASANVIKMVGATPVFVDIDPKTLNMDPEKAAKAITSKTKAILGVEAFGNPVGMHEIAMLAARHEIPLIEDSCEIEIKRIRMIDHLGIIFNSFFLFLFSYKMAERFEVTVISAEYPTISTGHVMTRCFGSAKTTGASNGYTTLGGSLSMK